MDKRYLLIIVIILICSVNLFLISNSSDVIGGASVNFKDYTFSIPKNFDLLSSDDQYVKLYNPEIGRVQITYGDISNDNDYKHRLDYLQNRSDITILRNGTLNIENTTVYSVFFQRKDSNSIINDSSFIFDQYGHRFTISVAGYDYSSYNETVDTVIFLIGSLRHNYKYNY